MEKVFKTEKNLFYGMSNNKLQEYYKSYKRYIITKECVGLWKNAIEKYKEFLNCNEYPSERIAENLCKTHMFGEIAYRFFQIIDTSNDLCKLLKSRK